MRRSVRRRLVLALSLLPLLAPPLAAQPDSASRPTPAPKAPRRRPVTPELARSAFADPAAARLLARARVARLAQDSALQSYDATSYQRITAGLAVRRTGLERLLFRGDNVARVQWQRGRALRIQSLGSRAIVPFGDAETSGSGTEFAAIPYFPGREALWFPSSDFGLAKADVDDREFVHPLAAGAEAYYRFATGDSVSIRLPTGAAIGLRELRITARRPEWNLFVGSFWFDTASAQLVRASYRMSRTLDVWPLVAQGMEQTRDSLRRAIAEAIDPREKARLDSALKNEDDVPALVTGLVRPLEASFDAITVEYALYNGRFWLPRANSAEGRAQAMFFNMPIRVDERFVYRDVDGDLGLPPALAADSTAQRTSVSINIGIGSGGGRDRRPARPDSGAESVGESVARQVEDQPDPRYEGEGDSTGVRRFLSEAQIAQRYRTADSTARALEAKGDTARARRLRTQAEQRRTRRLAILEQCRRDSTYEVTQSRYGGALRYIAREPCYSSMIARSNALPPPFAPGERIFDEGARDALIAALDDMGLQPGWGPERPQLRSGIDLLRFNRVEGLSIGAQAASELGQGYRATATARIGLRDRVPNGELVLERANGRQRYTGAVFHRLAAANADFGSPLSTGASFAALLYGRDEGFYYRTWGAEVGSTRRFGFNPTGGGTGELRWRLFGERQRRTGPPGDVIDSWSLARVFNGDARFLPDIEADRLDLIGLELKGQRTFGLDPRGWRAVTGLTLEGATGTLSYGRALLDVGVSRQIGRSRLAWTGMTGSSVGDLPVQRSFFIGGLRTVRGQLAGTQNGSAFWVARAEIATRAKAVTPVLFYDAGWAGPRADLFTPTRRGRFGRLQQGVGAGFSALDGFFRVDLARGLEPRRLWRLDFYLDARL